MEPGKPGSVDLKRGSVNLRQTSATCAECGCLTSLRWAGWRACRIDEPETGEPPAIAFFCPACATREFDD